MNTRKWLIVSGTVILVMLALAVGISLAQEPEPPVREAGVEGEMDVAAIAPGAIPIQGQLTDLIGNPLDGTYSLTFSLYEVASGGTALCSDTNSVSVDDGLFSSYMDYCYDDLYGQKVWLGVEVGSDGEMEPRQVIYPVPYALTLKPGAVISTTGYPALHVESTSPSGRGLRAYASATSGTNYGVVGASSSPNGYGGYFYNNGGGVGLLANTDSTSGFGIVGLQGDFSLDDYNIYWKPGGFFAGDHGVVGVSSDTVKVGAGVYGMDMAAIGTGYGVMGEAKSVQGRGVYGTATAATGTTYGVFGESDSDTGRGVYGHADANSGVNYGVYGESDSNEGKGVYGVASTSGGIGVEGESTVGSGVYGHSDSGYGVYGVTSSSWAIVGNTTDAGHNYGLYTGDNLYSANFHTMAARMQIVQNGGGEPLEPGDVVAFSGIGAPLEAGGLPTIQVVKATAADSTAVAGVVSSRFNIEAVTGGPEKLNQEITPEGPIQPGEYMLVVVQGPAQVKASALSASLQPGDLLSSDGRAGYAAKATNVTFGDVETVMPGTILGKVLEPLDEGEALIYIFVTLQ